ncbi:MAG: efflux RND transporter periplasmic adaptor subunit [Planctomycetota bacterium]
MKAIIPLLVLAAISAGILALGSLRKGEGDKPILHVADEVALNVNVSKPEQRRIVRSVEAPGDVEAVLEVDVSSEIVAKIEEMPVEEGDQVKAGDLLCRLNDDDLRAAVESGEARVAQLGAAVLQAEADIEQAERDCKRQLRLAEIDATSDIEMSNYLTTRKKTRAVLVMRQNELVETEAGLRRARDLLKRTIIESPIDGVVAKLSAKQGEVVVTGTMNNPGTVIMTISDLSKMQVRVRVDEVDVPSVKPGQRARVFLQSDQQIPVPAQVVRVAAKGSKEVGRDIVFFETLLEVLSDDPRIKPAMTANVEIDVAVEDDAVTIPVEAVVHRMRKNLPDSIVKAFDGQQEALELSERARQAQYIKVAYVMEGDVAKVRLITPGIADSRRVEIRDGIGADDQVIIGPYRSLDQLKDDRKVKLAEDEKDKKKDEEKADGDKEQEEKEEDGGDDSGESEAKLAEGQDDHGG